MNDNRWTITVSIPKPSVRISLATLLVVTVVGGVFLGLAGRRMLETGREQTEVEIENVLKRISWVEEAFVSVVGEKSAGKSALVALRARSGQWLTEDEREVVRKVVTRSAQVQKKDVTMIDLNSGRTWE